MKVCDEPTLSLGGTDLSNYDYLESVAMLVVSAVCFELHASLQMAVQTHLVYNILYYWYIVYNI